MNHTDTDTAREQAWLEPEATATLPRGGLRTEAQLIHALADQVRRRPVLNIHDAIHAVMHGEPKPRWDNLLYAVATDLHITPLNDNDRDELHVADGKPDQPGTYLTRLDWWAAQIGDPTLVAVALDKLAEVEERELVCIDEHQRRARVGGRAYLALAGGRS